MPYPAVLALHLLAVVTFGASLLLTGAMLRPLRLGRPPDPERRREWRRLFWLNLVVTTPALVVALLAGVTMARSAGWFAAGWLQVKLVLVAVLAVCHVAQVWWLYGAMTPNRPPSRLPVIGLLPVAEGALLVAITLLVTVKPG